MGKTLSFLTLVGLVEVNFPPRDILIHLPLDSDTGLGTEGSGPRGPRPCPAVDPAL